MRSDDGALDPVNRPLEVASSFGLLLQGRQEVLEDPCALPAVEATGDGTPRPIAFGQIAPRGSCAQTPSEAVQDAAMVHGGPSHLRFLGWEHRL
jgi:hypothetical protein